MPSWFKRYYQNGTHESNISQEGLLIDNDHETNYENSPRLPSPTRTNWYLHVPLILFYSLFYLAITISTLHALRSTVKDSKTTNHPCERFRIAMNQAQMNMTYIYREVPDPNGLIWESRRFPTNIVNNLFAGEPRPELDEAWNHLLQNDNIRVLKAYLEDLNLTTVYTLDGSERIVSLSVYHSFRCLKKVKRMLFKEYCHSGKSDEVMQREARHVGKCAIDSPGQRIKSSNIQRKQDHCIEYIRESLMCHPDLSMVSFRWINNTAQYEDKTAFYPTNFDVVLHKCANLEALDSWASKRMFDLFDVNLLQRPAPFQAGV
ncbi:hypothetical protein F5Y10DRAFT_266911 [Nemania abortiva]|nr:hypothetical protein F5Y10DRAFT_266911 [Nemania abortiva]